MQCGTNLSSIGKAMLIYSQDHGDLIPVAGGRGTKWGRGLRNWAASNRPEVFGLDPNGASGEATISSSLYLLVHYGYMSAPLRTFLCRGDKRVKEFKPTAYGLEDKGLTDVWDFGPDPSKHCSFAYQMVCRPYASKLHTSGPPGLAIAADRNPWMDRKRARDFSRFHPAGPGDSTVAKRHAGNTVTHQGDGQNVMFLDTHVSFEEIPYCSREDDNIYTAWDGKDKIRGKPPRLAVNPPMKRTRCSSTTCLLHKGDTSRNVARHRIHTQIEIDSSAVSALSS